MRKFFIFTILSSLFSLTLYAHGPTRQQVVESVVINAPVDKVWALVSDFSGLHKWHPAIQSTEMKGDDVRILTLAPDKKITEKLVKLDKEKMKLKYKITDMSVVETFEFAGSKVERTVLPVNTYTGFLSVVAEGTGSKVTWKGKFYRPYLLNPPTPEGMSDKDATTTISSVYKEGLDSLKMLLEGDGIKSTTPTAPAAPTPPVAPATTDTSKKTKVAFDPADSYSAHVKCEEGKKCKIDKFLLKGFRAFSQCQVCHGIDGNGSTIAPSLLEKLKKDITYDIFVDRVSNGFTGQMGVMPPWKANPNIMKKMENLYAYLKARSDGIIPAGRLKKFKH
ncbi:MAG: SRPBCC family protein [Cocleimonas sp.]|nr:SRPBCC family protein [Cocleimonas sp.]